MTAEARIYRTGTTAPLVAPIIAAPGRKFIEKAVAGRAEPVSGFEYLFIEGAYWPCVAFRNSDAQDLRLPLNSLIDNLWKKSVNARGGAKLSFLFGLVLVITGDEEFLEHLAAESL